MAGRQLPGGSQVEEIGYGSFQPVREQGRWRKLAITAAGLAVTSALVAAAAMAPSGGQQVAEMSESRALSMATTYFTGDKKAAAHSRLAAKTTELSSHSAAASMEALNQALGDKGAIHNVFDPKPTAVAPKPAPVAAMAAKPAAAPKPQAAAVVKPAVVVHHSVEEKQSPLKKLNHGDMFMGVMFKDNKVAGKAEEAKKAAGKPVGDDTVVAYKAAGPAGGQSLAMVSKKGAAAAAKRADVGVPRVIAKADRNIVADPFHDKVVQGSKGASTMWYN